MKKTALLFALIIVSAGFAAADIRLPDTPQPTATPTATPMPNDLSAPLNIYVGRNYKEPTLIIPRSVAKEIRAQLNAAESGNPTAATTGGISNISSMQTMVSGFFMSLALIFGGVWFWRGKSFGKNQKIVAGAIVCAFAGVSAITIFANIAPPPLIGIDEKILSDKTRSNYRGVSGTVNIKISVNDYADERMQLIIPAAK